MSRGQNGRSRPSLVPVLRTDRNGRTQIRHVRPDLMGDGERVIPAPQSPAAVKEAGPRNGYDLYTLIRQTAASRGSAVDSRSGVEQMTKGLAAATREDPQLLTLAGELLSSGSENARFVASEVLKSSLTRAGRVLLQGGTAEAAIEQGMIGAELRNNATIAWAAADVIDEFGERTHLNDQSMLRTTSEMQWLARKLRKVMEVPDDRSGPEWRWYWRGLAGLSRTNMALVEAADNGPEEAALVAEIVGILGHHTSVPAMVHALREHKAKAPADVVQLLKSLGEHPTPLADGVL